MIFSNDDEASRDWIRRTGKQIFDSHSGSAGLGELNFIG